MSEQKSKSETWIEAESDHISALGEQIRANPELGFRESRTAELLIRELSAPGVKIERNLAITGFKASAGPEDAPAVYLAADLDALPTAGAPAGVAHSCGHSAQMAAMAGAFNALVRTGLPEREGIRVVFVGSPAEEYSDMAYRLKLREEGKIQLFSGKQEQIRLGVYDDAWTVLKYHSMADSPERKVTVNGALDGFIAKRAVFLGVPAHSGAAPDKGVNALNAAALAQLAINTQRETFRDDDHIRVHPILKEGGNVVNTVPDRAVMETYVRGASFAAIMDAAAKVDRALAAGAIAVGAKVRVENLPGYQPLRPNPALEPYVAAAARRYFKDSDIEFHDFSAASDDIGDVAAVVPTIQLGCGGFEGAIHSADFHPTDLHMAYIMPALILAGAAEALAANKGAGLRAVRTAFKPQFTKEAYVAAVENMFTVHTYFWNPANAEQAERIQ